MADSSFDPLALVKAMGPQTDPFSWAQLYSQDAAKSEQLRQEIKNRLLIHEFDKAAAAREGALNRASHMDIAKYQQSEATKRQQMRNDQYKQRLQEISKNFDLGPGIVSEEDMKMGRFGIGGPVLKRDEYMPFVRGGKTWYRRIDSANPGMPAYPAPNPFETD